MRSTRLRILWVKTGLLHPLDTGGKLRTYNMLKEIRKRHQVTFLTLAPPNAPLHWRQKASEYCHEIVTVPWQETPKFSFAFYVELARNAFFSSLPYAIEKYRSPEMERNISELAKQDYDLVVCDFLAPAVNMNGNFDAPTLLFQHNVESAIWKRHYKTQKGLLKRGYLYTQWKRMAEFEKQSCHSFSGVVTVSPQDNETLRQEFGITNIIGHVPTGVDTDYFQPMNQGIKRPNHIVFMGSMDWLPNEDATLYFVKEIYPKIRFAIPEATFSVVGRNPSKTVKNLQEVDPTIRVTGTVEDIRPHVCAATAMVVPLRIGGGTRIKIFEGMAMGVPIVSTNVGAEGLPVHHGRNIMLAVDPQNFANETIDLLRNSAKAQAVSDSALTMVREHYSWKAVSQVFEAHCFALLQGTLEFNNAS